MLTSSNTPGQLLIVSHHVASNQYSCQPIIDNKFQLFNKKFTAKIGPDKNYLVLTHEQVTKNDEDLKIWEKRKLGVFMNKMEMFDAKLEDLHAKIAVLQSMQLKRPLNNHEQAELNDCLRTYQTCCEESKSYEAKKYNRIITETTKVTEYRIPHNTCAYIDMLGAAVTWTRFTPRVCTSTRVRSTDVQIPDVVKFAWNYSPDTYKDNVTIVRVPHPDFNL